MTLPDRPTRPLGRTNRRQRDDRLFMVATDDTHAPRQYFDCLHLSRVKVHVVPPRDAGESAAAAVVQRLKDEQERAQRLGDVRADDQFWVMLDTDHFVSGSHLGSFSRAIKEAREAGFRTAISNPCFELWLLLHVAEPTPPLSSADEVIDALRRATDGYDKTNIRPERFLPGLLEAIRRGKSLDLGSASGWPQSTGSQVVTLMEALSPIGEGDPSAA